MPEQTDQRRLGQILIDRGIITEKQLDEALGEQKASNRFIGEILVSRGASSEEEITKSLSEQLGMAFVDLYSMPVEPKAKEAVPEELCSKYTAVPLYMVKDTLTLAMANPLDVQAIDDVQSASGFRIKPVFACPTAIRSTIEHVYREQPGGGTDLSAEATAMFDRTNLAKAEAIPDISTLKQAASLAPVVNMVNSIITRAVEMGASDIHLEPERHNFNCRYRIDGILYPGSRVPLEDQAAVVSRIKIMANMDIAEKRLPQDGRVQMFAAGRDVDLRISTFPTIFGENLVIRILDRSGGILKLEQLGFSEASVIARSPEGGLPVIARSADGATKQSQKDMLTTFSGLIHRPHGIILVTGPTGSGKTTTLYAALSEINSLEKNIITLEDPVEYEIAHVRQSQVNVKAGLTFASGLRSIVRQDPDSIMIGEIRDKETADIAIHAALTGHLVFSTLHTNDAPSAAARLIDMGVEPFLVASSIIGILAQRLVRTLCPHCKEEYKPSAELLSSLRAGQDKSVIASPKGAKQSLFYKEVGCKKCKSRGYIGRAGIYELLTPNDRIKDLISQKAQATALRDEAVKSGMKTLRDAGLEKVMAGLTSVSELLRVTEGV